MQRVKRLPIDGGLASRLMTEGDAGQKVPAEDDGFIVRQTHGLMLCSCFLLVACGSAAGRWESWDDDLLVYTYIVARARP